MSVQQTIIKGIKEQLFFHDYLVLPNFGGFVLKSTPSHFSISGGLIVPPSKTVSFNAQLKQNDGILAVWLQNQLDCTATEALTHLHDFSEFCSSILNAKRRLSLENIGFFYLDFENNICFEPQQDSNFLSRSFGLGPVSIKEIEPEVNEIKKETVFVDRTIRHIETTEPTIKPARNYQSLIAPAALSLLFVTVLLLFVSNIKMNGELRSSLLGGDSKNEYTPIAYPDLTLVTTPYKNKAYVADANGIAMMELENKSLAVKAVEYNSASPNIRPDTKLHTGRTGKFEIVLGCFTILENANRMVHKLNSQRLNVEITGKNNKGMYVVGNDNFETKDEAISKLLELKDSFPNAWIKKAQ